MMARQNITDRAKRYRAQNAVTGPRKCVLCGSRSDLGVMHLTGNEDHGERANLAYGCRSCNQKLAAAFKRIGAGRPTNQYNPAKGVPTFEQYAFAVTQGQRKEYVRGEGWVSGAHDEAGAIIHATPKHKRIEYARRIAAGKSRSNPWPFSRPDARKTTPAHGGIAYHQGKLKSRKRADDGNAEFLKSLPKGKAKKAASSIPDEATLQAGFKRGLSLREILAQNPGLAATREMNPAKFDSRVKVLRQNGFWSDLLGDPMAGKNIDHMYKTPEEKRAEKLEGMRAKAEGTARGRRGRKNPASAAAEVFEEFHGFEPSEEITVTKHVHHHEHLAAVGKLTHLDVWGVDGKGHQIKGFKGALLAFNEQKNQLFVEGGDQSVNLDDFGIRQAHEFETLGKVTDIGYQTNKTHLGDEGGEAVYVHKFRSTNRDGRHVIVRIAREPDLIYDVRNEQLLFSGGSYEILREGIDK
jgi:hypothetical protein